MTFRIVLSSMASGSNLKSGVGVILSFMSLLIFSASSCGLESPTTFLSSSIPKISVPPIPFAKAQTLFNQLFGFFVSSATLNSYSVVSAGSSYSMSSLQIRVLSLNKAARSAVRMHWWAAVSQCLCCAVCWLSLL